MGGSLRVKIRKIVFWLHLTAGVLASVVILIMSLTGVCLAFETQIVARAESRLREVAPPSDGKRLSFDNLLEKARVAIPDSTPTGFLIRSEPASPLLVNFGREDVLYLNPYTGETLEHGSRIRGVMLKIGNWHRWIGTSESHRPAALAVASACNFVFLLCWFALVWPWLAAGSLEANCQRR
jgi:uncharacterized iron-regulated membrane protein